MLDIKFIRENPDLISEAARKKHVKFDVKDLVKADDMRRELLVSIESKRAGQNEASQRLPQIKDDAAKRELLGQMKLLKEDLQKEEEKLKEVMKNWQELMLRVPNIPDVSVPEGESDANNKEVKKWGEIPKFDFAPKSHIDLAESLDLADFETGAKVAGFRGYFLKNEGAELEFAVWQLAVDLFREKHPEYHMMLVPSLVRRETLLGTGYLPQGEDDLYKTQDADYLAGTAEVATMSYFADKVLKKDELPKKVLAFSPAFRREAGSYSKDVKGLYRVHEFMKFEQVILCEASHEESVKFHEELLANAENILQTLQIPYHVVVSCGGDLGLGQVKKYDIEAWMPSKGKYGETHSCSYFHDFQTRRLNIKYKDTDGKLKFAHSLNNTAIATPRILIQILENYQQADGTVNVPDALQKYMGGKKVIGKK
ncbi:MAG: serine--tRNA ligase [Patescibacteria group bacterium]|nr:serine--tRNA ligase [Patescibacteria group bacterium]MDE1946031.1 serine--tRNA ligase [Patescibacteria group bacterium]